MSPGNLVAITASQQSYLPGGIVEICVEASLLIDHPLPYIPTRMSTNYNKLSPSYELNVNWIKPSKEQV